MPALHTLTLDLANYSITTSLGWKELVTALGGTNVEKLTLHLAKSYIYDDVWEALENALGKMSALQTLTLDVANTKELENKVEALAKKTTEAGRLTRKTPDLVLTND